jgi:FkbM family methyltransferase
MTGRLHTKIEKIARVLDPKSSMPAKKAPRSETKLTKGINWSGIDRRSWLGWGLRLPLRLLPQGMVMTIRDGPAKGLKWISGSSNHGCWLGSYELEKQVALKTVVEPGMVVYDVGANVGFYSLFFSRLVGPRGKVFAFEPAFQALNYLVRHISMNGLENVQILQAALGEEQGLTGFTINKQSENHVVDERAALLVPVTKLDDTGFPPPHLIKMDIEGSEAAALRGARQLLIHHSPTLFIALHGEQQAEECSEFLNLIGYEIRSLQGEVLRQRLPDEICAFPKTKLPLQADDRSFSSSSRDLRSSLYSKPVP